MSGREKSPGGSVIYRYSEPRGFRSPESFGPHLDDILAHLKPFLGDCASVFYERVPDQVHVNILIFAPTVERNVWTLVTSGMSDRAMTTPRGTKDPHNFQYAELVMSLPPDWGGPGFSLANTSSIADEGKRWPLDLLEAMARFPHSYDTWLWFGHTIPNGDPPAALGPNTSMSGMLVEYPTTWPPEFVRMDREGGLATIFLALFPIYKEEMGFALDHGPNELVARFEAAGITEILDIRRSNVALYNS